MSLGNLPIDAFPVVSFGLSLVALAVVWAATKRFNRKWGEFGSPEKK